MPSEIVKALKFRKPSAAFDTDALGELLAEAYLKQRRESKFTKKETFSPSSLGYGNATCARYWKIAFDGADFVEKTDATGIAIMSNGTEGHTRLEQVFEDAGILEAKEVEIKLQDPPIRGYIDLIVNFQNERVIGEIKTTRSEAFEWRVATGKPKENNLLQLLIYMRAQNCQHGFLLYENKNTQEFLIIPVEMTPENIEFMETSLDWLRKVRTAWEDGEVPNRPYMKRNQICQKCPVQLTCWADDAPEATIKIEAMKVPKL
jgi:CRISPR/Cas system-associated exonuclease Cas4 (RecB family)